MRALLTASTLACLALTTGVADAAQMSTIDSAKKLVFTAGAGETNRLTVTQNGNTFTFTDTGATIDIGLVPSCSRVSVTAVSCTPDASESSDDGDVYRLKNDLGDMDDTATLITRRRADASGGTGDDSINGGAARNDIEGGDGDDHLRGNGGPDAMTGGGGRDTVDYSGAATPLTVSADGLAGDGADAEGDNVAADVELLIGGDAGDQLSASPNGTDVRGGPGDDTLTGGAGADSLDGGAGTDLLSGAGADDTIAARDGIAERVSCEDGQDSVVADHTDTVAADCEHVDLPAVDPVAPGAGTTTTAKTEPAAPLLGKRVTIGVFDGTVLVRIPGRSSFAELGDDASVPTGSVIDTRHGTVSLTAARDRTGATQSAVFRGGLFAVTQTKGKKPVTELSMRGGSFKACRPAAAGRARSAAAEGPVRSLFGSGHGRFRTRGRAAWRPCAAPSGSSRTAATAP